MDWSKHVLPYILLLFVSSGHGQLSNPKIDSLKHQIKSLDISVAKAEGYNAIAWQYLNINLNLAKVYIDSSTQVYETLGNSDGISQNNYNYGVWHRKSGDYSKALDYLETYKRYAKSVQDSFNIANASYQKGVVYGSQENYERALEEYYEALRLFEAQDENKSVGFVLNSLGIVHKNLGQFEKAVNSYQKSIAIHEELNDLNNLSNAYANLGNVYALEKQYDSAYSSYEKSLELDTRMKNNWGIAINYMDMATILTIQNQCKEALSLLESALELQKQNNFKKEQVETLVKIGASQLCLNNYELSQKFLLEAKAQAPVSKSVNKDIHYNLFELYRKRQNYDEALKQYVLYSTYKDSLYNEENLKNINTLQIKYETEKKDREIESQNLKLQQNETALLRQENELRLAQAFGALGIVLLVGLWLYFHQKRKLRAKEMEAFIARKELDQLEALIEGEEKERMRIAQDLHDGINGDLSAIKYKISAINDAYLNTVDNVNHHEAITMLDKAIEQIRYISHNLVPPSLQNFDLMESFRQLCAKIESSTALTINFQKFGTYHKLNKEAETALYRIVQELLHNTMKHSEATEVLLQINNHSDSMHLTVEDNGKGFDNSQPQHGLGHKNIASRVAFLNANLDIDTGNHGTTVNIIVPIQTLIND